MRMVAVDSLEEAVYSALLAALRDPDADVRRTAVDALGEAVKHGEASGLEALAAATAHLLAALGDPDALAAADRCAARICALMGEAGQWWWHYDSRKGDLIEGYPVYSIHQDAMAPMCLFELTAAGGANRDDAIVRGLRWLEHAPEVEGSLIDPDRSVIWRKVARRDPVRLVRALRGFASLGWSRSRLDFLERWFPPTAIDYECRPYHFGWMLYAWLLPH